MRTLLIGMGLLVLLSACNRRKYTEATAYNDAVVSFVEQSDIAMQNWNDNNFMQEYTLRKHNTVMRLLVVQDSLNHIAPLSGDDTLRLSALKIVDNYIETFAVFDTIYAMLSDSVFYPEDSIQVQFLLKSNQDTLTQQAERFTVLQKRFSERYGLKFM